MPKFRIKLLACMCVISLRLASHTVRLCKVYLGTSLPFCPDHSQDVQLLYMTEWTPRLLLISACNLVRLLFESGVYSRAASILFRAGTEI